MHKLVMWSLLVLWIVSLWPASDLYMHQESVYSLMPSVIQRQEWVESMLPGKHLTSISVAGLSSSTKRVCPELAAEEWPVLGIDSYAQYADGPIDELSELFEGDNGESLCVVHLARNASVAEREDAVVAWLGPGVRVLGVDVITRNVEADVQYATMRTEAVTIPAAMILFAIIFRSAKAVALLLIQLVWSVTVTFGVVDVVLRTGLLSTPHFDSSQCAIVELFGLAFCTDFTFLMLRRYAAELSDGASSEADLLSMRRTAGHVVVIICAHDASITVMPSSAQPGIEQFSVTTPTPLAAFCAIPGYFFR